MRRRMMTGAVWLLLVLIGGKPAKRRGTNPLASWNDGASKKSIVDFVDARDPRRRARLCQTRGAHRDLRPRRHLVGGAADVFPDHVCDGSGESAWRRSIRIGRPSSLSRRCSTAISRRWRRWARPDLLKIMAVTHTGITTDDFSKIVADWIATARHPRFDRPYTELVYQPMLELLTFLRANGFKTFIVSGGGVEFMRVFTERRLRHSARAGGGFFRSRASSSCGPTLSRCS